MKIASNNPSIRVAVCFLIAFIASIQAQELAVNGSFENVSNTFVPDGNHVMSLPTNSTVIPGWTTINAELLWAANTNTFGPTTPFGAFLLDLTGYHDHAPYAGVTQTIPTTPGETYEVSFSVGQYRSNSAYSGPMAVRAFAGLNTNTLFTLAPGAGNGNQWSNFQMNFTAQSTATVIDLAGVSAQGGQYLGFDNVSLVPKGGGPEPLINGSFENTDGSFINDGSGGMSLPVGSTNIPGWITTTAELGWFTNANAFGAMTPFGGMLLDLTGFHDSTPYGGVEQTVTTLPGQTYTLSFSVGVDQANPGFSGPVTVSASAQAGSIFTTTTNGGAWQTFTFTFLATNTATPITFIGNSTAGGQYLGLDNVSVTSAFSITSVNALLATNLVLGFDSELGHFYAVQSAADLTSPVWTILHGTTNAGNGGTLFVTLTNAISASRQFYRVEQLP